MFKFVKREIKTVTANEMYGLLYLDSDSGPDIEQEFFETKEEAEAFRKLFIRNYNAEDDEDEAAKFIVVKITKA